MTTDNFYVCAMIRNHQTLLFFVCLLSTGFSLRGRQAETTSVEPPFKIELAGFDNLYKVNADLYRCEQPDKAGMKNLQNIGIATVLNLRSKRNDRKEAKRTDLVLARVPINTWKMSYGDIVESLQKIDSAEKPIAVHCLHGSDRTGVVIAAYRMVNENWPKEAAIHEFKEKKFGYHENWFPKLLTLLESLDVDQLRKDLGQKE